ncbi:MAG: F0F1 ATP synthase subunit gamma [Candidatus Ancillula sp.]|jgi:F-type H+-transporting ATPase subunit gamma|nr:F0F1 ATP synthase subunit gamma [Candidatus Ancillula sp.]
MPSQLEYKKRLASTRSLEKIFSAQEMIAASRISKARDLALQSIPYAQAIADAVAAVATQTNIPHPLTADRERLGKKPTNRVAILMITSDRGMAGAYSAQIIRVTEQLCKEIQDKGKTPVIYACGRRGKSYYQFRGRELAASWEGNSDAPEFERAVEIADRLVEDFMTIDQSKAVDELYIVSTEFINMVSQKPKIIRMLPMEIVDDDPDDDKKDVFPLYLFEPGENEVLDTILPRYVRSRINECLLEAAASETASRQTAMHTATDNAKDLIEDLVRKSNQARQASITQELTEIVASADALKDE